MKEIIKDIPTEAVCAIITACGTVLSAVIAFFSSRYVSRKEIRKMKMQWEHDDRTINQKAFSEMVSAVSRYAQSGWSRHQREAMEKISASMIGEGNSMSDELSALYKSVSGGYAKSDIEMHLESVVKLRNSNVKYK